MEYTTLPRVLEKYKGQVEAVPDIQKKKKEVKLSTKDVD